MSPPNDMHARGLSRAWRQAVWFAWLWPGSLVREENGCWRTHGPSGRARWAWKAAWAAAVVLEAIWPRRWAPGRWGLACQRRILLAWWWSRDDADAGSRRRWAVAAALALAAMAATGLWRWNERGPVPRANVLQALGGAEGVGGDAGGGGRGGRLAAADPLREPSAPGASTAGVSFQPFATAGRARGGQAGPPAEQAQLPGDPGTLVPPPEARPTPGVDVADTGDGLTGGFTNGGVPGGNGGGEPSTQGPTPGGPTPVDPVGPPTPPPVQPPTDDGGVVIIQPPAPPPVDPIAPPPPPPIGPEIPVTPGFPPIVPPTVGDPAPPTPPTLLPDPDVRPPPPPDDPRPPGPVPEPSTWAMLIVGFGAVGAAIRRRRIAI